MGTEILKKLISDQPFRLISSTVIKLKLFRLHPAVWICAVVVLAGSWIWLPEGGFDWRNDIGPGIRAWWPSPWDEGLIMAPWGAMILSPLGKLPNRLATAITNGFSVMILAVVARKLDGPDWIAIPVLISPAGYWLFRNGQTEWLVLCGLILHNGLDVLLITIKPQIAIGVIIPRIKKSGGRWKEYLLPSVVVGTISLIVWPLWPLKIVELAPTLNSGNWNSSLWPWGIPMGIFILWYSWKTTDDIWGVSATPFLFPYLNLPNVLGLFIALAAKWPRGHCLFGFYHGSLGLFSYCR